MTADAPRPSSGRNKVLWGCLGVTVVSLLLLCGGGVLLGKKAWNAVSGMFAKVDEFVAEFKEQGYEQVTGQVIDVTDPVETNTVYKAQVVEFKSDATADLAFAAQVVNIHGKVDGDIDFLGQMLEIAPGGHVTGDIRVKWGQAVNVRGKVDGTISGDIMSVMKPPAVPPTPVPVETEEAPEVPPVEEAPDVEDVPAEAPQPEAEQSTPASP